MTEYLEKHYSTLMIGVLEPGSQLGWCCFTNVRKFRKFSVEIKQITGLKGPCRNTDQRAVTSFLRKWHAYLVLFQFDIVSIRWGFVSEHGSRNSYMVCVGSRLFSWHYSSCDVNAQITIKKSWNQSTAVSSLLGLTNCAYPPRPNCVARPGRTIPSWTP